MLSNPIHTDIAIPIDDALARRLSLSLRDAGMPVDHPGARYIVFGWGSRAFYMATPTWAELKPWPLLKALTLDASVMHVDIAGAISRTASGGRGFDVSEARVRGLLTFIRAVFTRMPNGAAVESPDAGLRPSSTASSRPTADFNRAARLQHLDGARLREAGIAAGWWNPLPVTLRLVARPIN